MKLLGKLLKKRNNVSRTALTERDIFYIFNRVLREEFGNIGALNLIADFFKNKTLFIKSRSSAWGSELFSNRTSIIKKINKELGSEEIKEIKLK
jgi:hypothetical protein